MTENPKARVELKDFPGLMTNVDPDDVTAGAGIEQTNVGLRKSAQLTLRGGYREVVFEDD
jgi:hypothetical protein